MLHPVPRKYDKTVICCDQRQQDQRRTYSPIQSVPGGSQWKPITQVRKRSHAHFGHQGVRTVMENHRGCRRTCPRPRRTARRRIDGEKKNDARGYSSQIYSGRKRDESKVGCNNERKRNSVVHNRWNYRAQRWPRHETAGTNIKFNAVRSLIIHLV
jgi:hypothetical protein